MMVIELANLDHRSARLKIAPPSEHSANVKKNTSVT